MGVKTLVNSSIIRNNDIRIINRVGRSSNLRLGSNSALMAINAKDVLRILEAKDNIQMVILECIDIGEEEHVKEMVGNDKIDVVSVCKDAITKAKSEELGINIVRDERDLYKYIENKLGIKINYEYNWKITREEKGIDFSDLIGDGDSNIDTDDGTESAELELMNLRSRIKYLEDDLSNKLKDLRELKDDNSSLNEIVNRLTEKVEDYEINYGILELKASNLEKIIKEYEDKISNLEEKLGNKDKYIEDLRQKSDKNIEELGSKVDNLELELKGKDIEIYSLESKVNELQNEVESLQKDVEEYMNLAEKLKIEVVTERGKSEALETEIESYEDAINELKDELKEVDDNLKKVRDESKIKEGELKARINELIRINNNLEEYLKEYKSKLRNIEESDSNAGNENSFSFDLELNYTGKAKIINVFGFGGYGITTTAVSIARKLATQRVLFIDLDIKSPKANKLLNQAPIIEDLVDIRNKQERSGLGALINKGAEYVIANKEIVLRRCLETRQGYLDYMSGVYYKADLKSLELSLPRFLNTVGNDYDYIVIDCGKVGQSSMQDWIIKGLSKCDKGKNVAVTYNDKLDVRNLNITFRDNEISYSNTLCVLNFSVSTSLDVDIMKSLSKYEIVAMPRSMEMYGENLTYDRVKILRDILASIIDFVRA